LWSAQTTWGGGFLPIAGDLVSIPKGKNVLLDVSTPILNTVIVEGTLIFKDTDLNFNAKNVLVIGGHL
jgi:hypothetical protein